MKANAFMEAVSQGDLKAVQALIAVGADLNAKHNDGATALTLAREKGNAQLIDLLEKAEAKDSKGKPKVRK